MPLRGSVALVTGGAGAVGAVLVRRLIGDGVAVHAILRPETDRWRIADIGDRLVPHEADLTDTVAVRRIVGDVDPDVMFHLARHRGNPAALDYREAYAHNVEATLNLLEAAEVRRVKRFVHVGSSLEYDLDRSPLRESDAPAPRTAHGVTKAAATLLAQHFARERGLPVVVLRVFTVYGPWEAPKRFVPQLMLAALENRPLSVTSDRNLAHDWILVDDVVEACVRAATVDGVAGEVVNVGTGCQSTNEQLIGVVEKLVGRSIVRAEAPFPKRTWDTAHWVADVTKARERLGWHAEADIHAGLGRTLEWFRSQPQAVRERVHMTRALTLGLVVFVLALWRSLADSIGLTDESWFLQVVARIRGGDVLYRDVFLGVTPLSAWVTAGVTLLVGIEIVAVKIVTNACFAATTVLSGRLAKEAGLSSGASVVVMAAMFIWARPYNNPPYTPMAMAFFTAALVVSLAAAKAGGRAAPAWRGWLGAGTLAGLSFASKQNVGLLALACVGAGVIAAGGADWLRLRTRAGWATAGFGAVVLVVLVPVAVSGGLPALWDYGFSGKGAYLDIGSVSYLGSLRETFAALSGVSSASGLSSALHGLVTVLPLAVLLAAVAASKRLDRFDWLLIVFAAATTLSALPRWDRFHMAYAVPVHLVAIGRIAPRLSVRWPGPALRRATPWAVVGLAVVVAARPLVTVGRSGSTPLDMVHFRGARVRSDRAAGLRADAAALRSAAGGRPVFVVTRDAGFWYLASGTRNPTPFDIPARTATGTNGIPMLLDQLHEGKLDLVCLDDGPPDAQSLVEVEAYVREHYQTGADLGPCTMFTAPADGVVRKRQRS